MPRVIHFEIPADKPARAISFYRKAFGWKIGRWTGPQPYWLVDTGKASEPGIHGAIAERKSLPVTTNTVSVPSVDRFMKRIKAAGGKVLTQKMTIPGIGYMAYCQDTEKNMFGIMENDPKAK